MPDGSPRAVPVNQFFGPFVAVALLFAPASVGGGEANRDGSVEEETRLAFPQLLAELRAAYPDRDSTQRHHEEIVARLETFLREHPTSPESAEARALAGEVLLLGGKTREARRYWQQLAREGPTDEDRARGLYLLGDESFLRDPADGKQAERYLKAATTYFIALVDHFPESRWAIAARQPLKYLTIRRDGVFPPFEATFRQSGEDLPLDEAGLRGKLLVLDYWRSSSPKQADFETQLARDMVVALEEYEELQGRVEVLGINLDLDSSRFEAARNAWNIPWAQHHDGLGFESPLVAHLGIPRVPHFVLVDPHGAVLYMGASAQRFFARATTALRDLRANLPERTPTKDERARCLALLSEYHYREGLRNGSHAAKHLQTAREQLRRLRDTYPDSRWIWGGERVLKYLEVHATGTLPDFEATFSRGAQTRRLNTAGLKGKLVVIDYWKAATPGQKEFEAALAGRLAPSRLDPRLRARVEVLGVNLDEERSVFETATAQWGLDWLQHHDGRGLESPLAEVLGIPSAPHLALIDPQGRLVYLGPNRQRFFTDLAAALERLGEADEK